MTRTPTALLRTFALLGALVCAMGADLPPPPPAERFSPAEEQALAAREVVQRYEPDQSSLIAAVDVAADADRTFREVMDIEARVGEVKGFQKVHVYVDQPDRRTAEIHIGFGGFTGTVYIDFRMNRSQRWTMFGLDPNRKSDMNPTSGSYHVIPNGAGSRILYRSSMSGVSFAPSWLQKYMATTASKELLAGIRARSERP